MSKNGERNYLKNIGPEGILHACNKPFSDKECGNYLMDLGFIMALLPPPPLKLLDVGCGTGWTSRFFAKQGYEVTGQDISEDMIFHANILKEKESLPHLNFVVGDYEDMNFGEVFDIAVFYDSLHHASDPEMALKMVYKFLRPGGICLTCEPGKGHADFSVSTEQKYDVTEQDMPPLKIRKLALNAGFQQCKIFPRITEISKVLYKRPSNKMLRMLLKYGFIRKMALLYTCIEYKRENGVLVLKK